MGRIRLVPRADDAGLNRTTNRAIRSVAREGIVRNISLMAPAPEIEDAAETLAGLANRVDFGLHLTLTSEWDPVRWGPVTGVDAHPGLLRRDGTFHLKVEELTAAEVPTADLMNEVENQFSRLTDLGFKLSYLDEHMGLGAVPGLADVLREFAGKHGLVYDPDLRADGRLKTLPDWAPGEHPGTELADYLAGLEAGTYLLVGHPGTKDEQMQLLRHPGEKPGVVALQRNRERRMFMDIEIVDYCENVGIDLLRYSEI